MDEAAAVGDIILFIDEIHNIIGAGAAEGSIDAANILKPQLSRGEIQLMGATTVAEYRRYTEKDSALERRFQKVNVEEPDDSQTVRILRGILPRYEQHHGVHITEEAVQAAVRLSRRYLNDRFLPDKAIDLMDEAAAKVCQQSVSQPDTEYQQLDDRLHELREQKEAAICGRILNRLPPCATSRHRLSSNSPSFPKSCKRSAAAEESRSPPTILHRWSAKAPASRYPR